MPTRSDQHPGGRMGGHRPPFRNGPRYHWRRRDVNWPGDVGPASAELLCPMEAADEGNPRAPRLQRESEVMKAPKQQNTVSAAQDVKIVRHEPRSDYVTQAF